MISIFTATGVAITIVLLIIIIQQLKKIRMTNEEVLALLEQANTITNEIAADLQDLIDNSGVSQEVADKLSAHVEKLKAVAATHTPASPSEETNG